MLWWVGKYVVERAASEERRGVKCGSVDSLS